MLRDDVCDNDALDHMANNKDVYPMKQKRRYERCKSGDSECTPSTSVPTTYVMRGCVHKGKVRHHELEAALNAKG